jgi:PD-(D/E)XK nuclease superfamily
VSRPQRLLGDIVSLTPSRYDRWLRCPRELLLADLLGLPASDDGPTGALGELVHGFLRFVHANGSCHDTEFVAEQLDAHGIDSEVLRSMIASHRRRCPRSFDDARHEVAVARLHQAKPMFMATARIDAVWIHDGIFDARDYKTGRVATPSVGDDGRARLQAWILARYAQRRGLSLQLRYEHLAPEVDDDPEPFTPDAEQLDAITEELRAAVTAIRSAADTATSATSAKSATSALTSSPPGETSEFVGVGEIEVCGRCRYRSLCTHSAVRGEPAWPAATFIS